VKSIRSSSKHVIAMRTLCKYKICESIFLPHWQWVNTANIDHVLNFQIFFIWRNMLESMNSLTIIRELMQFTTILFQKWVILRRTLIYQKILWHYFHNILSIWVNNLRKQSQMSHTWHWSSDIAPEEIDISMTTNRKHFLIYCGKWYVYTNNYLWAGTWYQMPHVIIEADKRSWHMFKNETVLMSKLNKMQI